jgi:hypothetical protein
MSDAIEKVFVISATSDIEAIESQNVPKIGTRYIVTKINGKMIEPRWCIVEVTLEVERSEVSK